MQSLAAARVVAFLLAALAVFLRLGPNLAGAFNFNPVGAIGLFGGARLKSWQAYLLPLCLMVATDLALAVIKGDPEYGLTDPSRLWVYGCYALYVVIGRWVVGDCKNPFVIGGATLLGTTQFFLITNFFEWLRLTDHYTQDLSGLMSSYIAAFWFSRGTLTSDVIFTALAFLAHAYLTREASAPARDYPLTIND
jgi:hypothetical protein